MVWFGLPDEVSHLCLIFLSLQLTQVSAILWLSVLVSDVFGLWFGLPDEVSHLCLIFLSLELTQGECHTLAQQSGGTPLNREINN